MNCQSFVDHLLEYSSGELDGALTAQADAHSEQCSNCRAFAATYRAVPRMVEWALSEPADLEDAAREALAAELTEADQEAIEQVIETTLLAELRKLA